MENKKPSFCILNGKNTCKKVVPQISNILFTACIPSTTLPSYLTITNNIGVATNVQPKYNFYNDGKGNNYLYFFNEENIAQKANQTIITLQSPYKISKFNYLVVGGGGGGSSDPSVSGGVGGGGGGGQVTFAEYTKVWDSSNRRYNTMSLSLGIGGTAGGDGIGSSLYLPTPPDDLACLGGNSASTGTGGSYVPYNSNSSIPGGTGGGGGAGAGTNVQGTSGLTGTNGVGGNGGIGYTWSLDSSSPYKNLVFGNGGGGGGSTAGGKGGNLLSGNGGTPKLQSNSGSYGGGGGGSGGKSGDNGATGGGGVVALYWLTSDVSPTTAC